MKVLIERIVCEVMKTTIHNVLVLMYCVIDLTYAIAIKFQKSSCHGFQQWNFKFDLVDNACGERLLCRKEKNTNSFNSFTKLMQFKKKSFPHLFQITST